MKKQLWGFAATAALAAMIAVPASAHRQWMMPSSTVLSGDDVWVTVDAAVSNDLFYFEHQPLRLDAVKAWAPDGTQVQIENKATGRYRSTFDVHLTQKGTWKIESAVDGVMGSYDLGGKTERLPRGTTTANLAERIPARRDQCEDRRDEQPQPDFRDGGRTDRHAFQADRQGHRTGPGDAPQRPDRGRDGDVSVPARRQADQPACR